MESFFRRHHTLLAWLGVMLFLLIPYLPYMQRVPSVMDEATLLVYPELVSRGALPYRDFETFYGPANAYLLAAVYSLSALDLGVERWVALLYRLAALSALYCLLRRSGWAVAAGGTLLAGLLLVPLELTASAWLGGVACALWALVAGWLGPARWRAPLAGLLAAGALLFRPDLGPAILLSAIPLFLAFARPERWRWLAGLAVGLLPLAVLAFAAGPMQLWNNLFLYPAILSSPGRRLPLSFVEGWLVRLLVLHALVIVFSVAAAARLAWVERPRWSADSQSAALLAVALFGFGITHQLLQRLDVAHLFAVAFVAAGVLPALLATWLRRLEGRSAPSQTALALVLPLVALMATSPELTTVIRMAISRGFDSEPAQAPVVENHGRRYLVRSPKLADELTQLIAHAEQLGTDGQRLFVGPADLRRTHYVDTFLYHLLPRFNPATYFLEMNPLSANRPGSRLAADLASADLAILNTAWNEWREPNESQRFGSEEPNAVLARQFERVGVYGTFHLFRKRAAAAP